MPSPLIGGSVSTTLDRLDLVSTTLDLVTRLDLVHTCILHARMWHMLPVTRHTYCTCYQSHGTLIAHATSHATHLLHMIPVTRHTYCTSYQSHGTLSAHATSHTAHLVRMLLRKHGSAMVSRCVLSDGQKMCPQQWSADVSSAMVSRCVFCDGQQMCPLQWTADASSAMDSRCIICDGLQILHLRWTSDASSAMVLVFPNPVSPVMAQITEFW